MLRSATLMDRPVSPPLRLGDLARAQAQLAFSQTWAARVAAISTTPTSHPGTDVMHRGVAYLAAASQFLAARRAAGTEPDAATWKAWDETVGVAALATLGVNVDELLTRLSPAAISPVELMESQILAGNPVEMIIPAYGRRVVDAWRRASGEGVSSALAKPAGRRMRP